MDITHTPKRVVAAAFLAAGLTLAGIGLAAGDAHAQPGAESRRRATEPLQVSDL